MMGFNDHEHRQRMFSDCRRPCIGGRMFWTLAEPQWQKELGYVGLCSHCGWQVFSQDLLKVVDDPRYYVGRHGVLSSPQFNKRRAA